MKTKKLFSHRVNDAVKLINLSEINFEICKEIQNIFKRTCFQKNGQNRFLILTSNNAFNCSVETLHTLLCSAKKNDIRLRPLLEEKIRNESRIVDFKTNDIEEANQLYDFLMRDYPDPNCDNYDFLKLLEAEKIGDKLALLRKIKRQADILKILDGIKKDFETGNFHKVRHLSIAHKVINLKEPSGAEDFLLKEDYMNNLSKIIRRIKMIICFGFDYDYNLNIGQKQLLIYLGELIKAVSVDFKF